MRKLVLRSNYNVLLWHFVDSISEWDVFVGPHLAEYFDKNYAITDNDKEALNSYVGVRSEFGWSGEGDLFHWAYDGFQEDARFSQLYKSVKHLETKLSKDGMSIKEILTGRLNDIESLLKGELDIFAQEEDIDNVVCKMLELTGNQVTDDSPVYAYIAASMSASRQGGANGSAIYSEAPLSDDIGYVNGCVSEFLIHEYMHKAVMPREWFKSLGSQFEYKNENVFPDDMSAFFDEVLIYSASTVYLSKQVPEKRIERIVNQGQKNTRHYTLWRTVARFYPLIKEYLDGRSTLETTQRGVLELADEVMSEFRDL